MMSPWVQRLLIANFAVFLLMELQPEFVNYLALSSQTVLSRPWTPVTYMFAHAGPWHLLMNMLMLFFFGPRLERRLGSRAFAHFYLLCGLCAGLVSMSTPSFIVGASGAIYGVLAAFAVFWPRQTLHIWGVVPVQARTLVIALIVLSFVMQASDLQQGVAHFAHIGGALAGWIYVRELRKRALARRQPDSRRAAVSKAAEEAMVERWSRVPLDKLHELNREEFGKILSKAKEVGAGKIPANDRQFMERISRATS